MNRAKCIKCGRENPEYDLDFITVRRTVTKSTVKNGDQLITTTTTGEAVEGTFHGSVCKKCIRKEGRFLSGFFALIVMVIGFAVVFLGTLLIGGNEFSNTHMGGILIAAAVSGVVLGVLCFIFIMRSFNAKDLAGRVIKDARKTPDLVYVLCDREYYKNNPKIDPTIYAFKMKTGLKTKLADELFNIICGGNDPVKALQEAMALQAREEQS